ncbi:MAG TPA: TPM domain-containing protein [Stenotrophomonas sp.]|nr:TPM domain-containing protein [Stenotrophomonas sp.]
MRWFRHLFAPTARKLFPPDALDAITQAIAAGEQRHSGEVMFAVEADLALAALWAGVTPRQRAEAAFAQLRTWDTHANNGVLIYLLLADHAIEIVADRGLHGRVSPAQWQEICRRMQGQLQAREPVRAVVEAIEAVSSLIAEHYPAAPGQPNADELPNRPRFLG